MAMGEKSCWKTCRRGSIRPELLMITRNGKGSCFRRTRCARSDSSGRPMLMLSFLIVFRPTSSASPAARISSRRCLSRLEVKSAGVKLRVEIFPSHVIAKLTATTGRRAVSLAFRDFMLQFFDRFVHLTHACMLGGAVEQVDDAAANRPEDHYCVTQQ